MVEWANVLKMVDNSRWTEDDNSDKDLSLALCFTLYQISGRTVTESRLPLVIMLPEEFWELAVEEWSESLSVIGHQVNHDVYDRLRCLGQNLRSSAIVVVGLLASSAHQNIDLGGESYPELCLPGSPTIPPTLNETRLQKLMEFPPPFSSSDHGHLGVSHLAKMTSPEYMEDGKWTGVYTIPRTTIQASPRVEPLGIGQFRVCKHPRRPGKLNLRAGLHPRTEKCPPFSEAQCTDALGQLIFSEDPDSHYCPQ